MRITHHPQRSLLESFSSHPTGRELSAISHWLDAHPEILSLAANDLIRVNTKQVGCQGLTVENVLRCAIIKQRHQLSYHHLAFHLEDSASFRAFARLDHLQPKRSCLQKTISLIKPTTWERINHILLQSASLNKLEDGKQIRVDSTAVESNIHYPTDSSLLYDAVRVMVRLLNQAKPFHCGQVMFCNRLRRAKNLSCRIRGVREKKRRKYYRELIGTTEETLGYLQAAKRSVESAHVAGLQAEAWLLEARQFEPLIERVIDQARRRVLQGEPVDAEHKVLSLFEPHTDIIAKGGRQTTFGHKLNLATGKSNLILDVVIEQGNPADSSQFMPMVKRQESIYNCVPQRTAADGGYASIDNLTDAKTIGVKEVVFSKKRGLEIEAMAKSPWVYRQLKNFRAGIEANISCLKRTYGLTRCLWRGVEKFKAYVWSSVLAYNLTLFARFINSS